jgi:hypothetical protein
MERAGFLPPIPLALIDLLAVRVDRDNVVTYEHPKGVNEMPASVTAVNGTASTKTSGGISVPAYSKVDVSNAADVDIVAFLNLGGTSLLKSGQAAEVRHMIRKVQGIGQNPGV